MSTERGQTVCYLGVDWEESDILIYGGGGARVMSDRLEKGVRWVK
jgi:hypothetical protein